MFRYKFLILLGAASLAACDKTEVQVSEVLNSTQCNVAKRGFKQIQWQDLAGIRGAKLLTDTPVTTSSASASPSPEPGSAATSSAAATRATQAEAQSGEPLQLFVIYNGLKPTPGYRFVLQSATSEAQEVQLRYQWRTPDQDAVLAQVLTSPCSVVQVGSHQHVQTVSAWVDGDLVERITLSQAKSSTQ